MIEEILFTYIGTQTTVPVYAERPNDTPEEYYILEKTGSERDDLINRATFAVQSISKASLHRAAELNEAIKEIMDAAVVLPEISAADLNSDYNFTDTETKEYRYQAVYDVYY